MIALSSMKLQMEWLLLTIELYTVLNTFYKNTVSTIIFHKWEKAIDILYLLMVIFYLLRNYITKITYSTLHNLTL